MSKVQRGRWSTKVNVLKQDRIVYDNEGFAVGYHDGSYKLGRYLVEGFSEEFYRSYEEGYILGFNESDSSKDYKSSVRNSPYAQNKNYKSGCLPFIIIIGGIGVLVDIINRYF